MKHTLLSALAFTSAMFASVGAFAQWAAPTPPVLDEVNAASVEAGHTYYIKNVAAGQFITGSNAYSTRVSLTVDGINSTYSPAIAILVADSTGASTNLTGVSGKTLRLNGAYTINGDGGKKTFTNTYLFRDNEEASYVDHASQDKGYIWNITKGANGYYRIQTAEGDPTYPEAATQYAGWDSSLGEIEFDPSIGELVSGTTIVTFNMEEGVEGNEIDWMFIPAEEFMVKKAAYNSRLAVYEKYLQVMEEAQFEGVTLDVSAAEAIYNNASATEKELQSAIKELDFQLNSAKFRAQFYGTAQDPQEVTELCLVNPSFAGNINGWDNTFKSGVTAQNCGYQGWHYTNDGRKMTGETTDEDGTPAGIDQFIEAWRLNTTDPHRIGDAQLSQTVYGLPNGMYELTCNAIATQQGDWFPNPVTGVKLFIATDDGAETFQEIATYNNNPEHFSVIFVCPPGVKSLTFGLKTEDATANWIAADNFRIYYYGETEDTPEQLALKNAFKTIEPYYNHSTDDEYSKALDDELATIHDNAQQLIYSHSDDMEATKAAIDAISDIRFRIVEEATAYKRMRDLIEITAQSDLQKYQERSKESDDAYDKLCTGIENVIDDYQGKLEDRTYDVEAINTDIEAYNKMVEEGIAAAKAEIRAKLDAAVASGQVLDEDLELTELFDGMNVVYSTSAKNYPNLPDTLWQNAYNDTHFKTQYGTAEVWNSTTFDIYRELELPKGKYTIMVNAFYREADNLTNYVDYISDAISGYSYLYAGNAQKLLTNVARFASEEEVSGWSTFEGPEGTIYIPASQYAAHSTFNDAKYAEQTLTTVSAVLSEDGILRFGMRSGDGLMGDQWTVWENFRIFYNAAGTSDYDIELESLIAQATDATHGGVIAAKNKLEKGISDGDKALGANDAAAKVAAIEQLVDAIQYAAKATELAQKITNTIDDYIYKLDDATVISNYEGFDGLLAEISDAVAAEEFESNEKIEGWFESLPLEWNKYLLGWVELDDASGDNPVDFSLIITNPTFDSNGYAGWTADFETKNGTDTDGCVEFWNSSNFDFHQELPMLRPGFYRLSANAFYRQGNSADEIAVLNTPDSLLNNNAYLYAGDVAVKLVQWSDLERGALAGTLAENQEEYYTLDAINYTLADESAFCAPNSRVHFRTFIEAGRYNNYVIFEYKEGQGPINIGIRKESTVGYDWVPIDNFVLEYLGTEPPVAVNSIAADTNAAPATIYNLAGQQVTRMQKGIYIQGGRKVLVK